MDGIAARLKDFREQLEREMAPVPLTELEVPALLLLNDLCQAFHLTEEERRLVLGERGFAAVQTLEQTTVSLNGWENDNWNRRSGPGLGEAGEAEA